MQVYVIKCLTQLPFHNCEGMNVTGYDFSPNKTIELKADFWYMSGLPPLTGPDAPILRGKF